MPPIVIDEGAGDFLSQITRGLTAAQPGVFQALNYKRGLAQDEQAKQSEDHRLLLLEQQLQRQQAQDEWQKARQEQQDVWATENQQYTRGLRTREEKEDAEAKDSAGILASWQQGAKDQPEDAWEGFDPSAMQAGVEQHVPPTGEAPQQPPKSRLEAIGPHLSGMAPAEAQKMIAIATALDKQDKERAMFEDMVGNGLKPGAADENGQQTPPVIDQQAAKGMLFKAAIGDLRGAAHDFMGLMSTMAKGQTQVQLFQMANDGMATEIQELQIKRKGAKDLGMPSEVLALYDHATSEALYQQNLMNIENKARPVQGDRISSYQAKAHKALQLDVSKLRKAQEGASKAGKKPAVPGQNTDGTPWSEHQWYDRAVENATRGVTFTDLYAVNEQGEKTGKIIKTAEERRREAINAEMPAQFKQGGGGAAPASGEASPWAGFQGAQAQGQAPATNGKAPMPVQQKGALDGNATGQHLTREQILEYLKAHGVPVPE